MSANGKIEKNVENIHLEVEEQLEKNNNKVVDSSDDASCVSTINKSLQCT